MNKKLETIIDHDFDPGETVIANTRKLDGQLCRVTEMEWDGELRKTYEGSGEISVQTDSFGHDIRYQVQWGPSHTTSVIPSSLEKTDEELHENACEPTKGLVFRREEDLYIVEGSGIKKRWMGAAMGDNSYKKWKTIKARPLGDNGEYNPDNPLDEFVPNWPLHPIVDEYEQSFEPA